jgi:PAS domain S-box-containing protein
LLRAFSQAIPDIAFIVDEDGRYIEVLAAPEREGLLLEEANALKGRTIHDVMPKSKADTILAVLRRIASTGKPQTLEYFLDVPAGRTWFEGRGGLIDFPGEKRMIVWVAQDITERKRAERALRKEREHLAVALDEGGPQPDGYGLTIRELAVLQLIVEGKSDKEIATILDISNRTVGKHVESILSKMGARSRLDAGVRAFREGLVWAVELEFQSRTPWFRDPRYGASAKAVIEAPK